MRIKFGTDGWRGIIADDFTFENVRYCAQSMAEYLKTSGLAPRGAVIGYDTRFASEDFAAAAAEVLAGNDIKVYLCKKATPTPVVSFGVRHLKTGGAIIITASHNPGRWNGFKIKSPDGASAPTEVERQVEAGIPDIIDAGRTVSVDLEQAVADSLVEYVDLDAPYMEHIGKLVDVGSIRNSGLRIVVDSMYGAGIGYFQRIVGGGPTIITEINGERNPIFPGIQPEPIARHLGKLSSCIKETGASIGLATDGDADRIGIVDDKGNPLTPLQIFALLALYLLEVRGERGPIVKTITTTNMLFKLGKLYNVPVFETAVGFKYVAPLMLKEDALIGGEESSGFGFRGHLPERDGILAGLYILDFMNRLDKTPSELISYLYSKVGPHHYQRLDIEFRPSDRERLLRRLSDEPPESIAGKKVVKASRLDGYHFSLSDSSWLLFRFSGTEPLLRIYAEASSMEKAKTLVAEGRQLLQI